VSPQQQQLESDIDKQQKTSQSVNSSENKIRGMKMNGIFRVKSFCGNLRNHLESTL